MTNDGEFLYRQEDGMATLDHEVPIRTDTVFHVASVSTEFTAEVIALLVLADALSFEHPVQPYLSWVPDLGYVVMVCHLVHRTSGLRGQ